MVGDNVLWITSPTVAGPFFTSGSGAGDGGFTVPAPIPLIPRLNGEVVYLQGILVDPAAASGFAL